MTKKRPLTQLHLFGRLRHIEMALAREIQALTKYERSLAIAPLTQARDLVREADEALSRIDEHRRKRKSK